MSSIIAVTTAILKGTTSIYTFTVTDESGAALALADIATMTLTYYDKDTLTIINSRNGQDIRNTNNVIIATTGGLLTWTIQATDTVLVDSRKSVEKHIALFNWTHPATPAKAGRREVQLSIEAVKLG